MIVRVLVAFVFLGSMPLVDDALSYSEEAAKLIQNFPGDTAYFWPPGLPYVLAFAYALFGHDLFVSRMSAIIISVANVVMIARLSHQILKEGRAARLSGWMAAFYPPDVLMAGQTFSQHLAMLCLLLLAYWLLLGYQRGKWWYYGFGGVAFGWGGLTRPSVLSIGVMLLIVWFVVLLKCRSELSGNKLHDVISAPLVFFALASVCILPVMYHNARLGAGWTISTNNERNLFLGNNTYTHDYKTSHFGQRSLEQIEPEARAYLMEVYDRNDARQAMVREALSYMADHPFITMVRTMNRIRAFWGFDYIMSREIQHHYSAGMVALALLLTIEAGGYCAVMVFVLAGLVSAWEKINLYGGALLILLTIGYQMPYALAFSGGTYHFPVMGLLMPFSAAAMYSARSRGVSNRMSFAYSRRFLACLVIFLLVQFEYAYYSILLA